MVNPFRWSEWNTRWNVADGVGYRCDNDVFENRYRFIARYDEDGSTLLVWRF